MNRNTWVQDSCTEGECAKKPLVEIIRLIKRDIGKGSIETQRLELITSGTRHTQTERREQGRKKRILRVKVKKRFR